ncbi:alpha/beta fold hydrolase [Marasmitruncus massiliensis]|uniref:alpha/beta fold hydrolase n=1 Tax=Marasmitruncus massiliensis TaxID=1944642 RepID=UPI000C7A65D6|nr:alpha/beta hydrolase [Marasmitruncus massiliensis]
MNITVKQIEFKSTDGVSGLFGWIYIPAEGNRGVIQIIHGMAEHMGRYHEFMRELAQHGYVACGIDQLGHGRSAAGAPLGFFAEQDGWRILIDDQYKFNKIIRSEIPGCNVVLLGHSMGSLIARLFAAKYPQSLSALIISGTTRAGIRVETAIQLANRSVKKNGPAYPDAGLDKLAFGNYNDQFQPAKTKFDWLSRDRELVRLYTDDARCGFLFTASAFRDLFILIRKANARKCYANTLLTLPILLISGSMDPAGEFGKGPEQVYERYIKAGVSDVELVLYEGGRHEMLNENNRAQVYLELLDWLDKHLACMPPDEEDI